MSAKTTTSTQMPTVENWLFVLRSKLTQYDMATSKREAVRGRVNIYRLGHLLGAAERVEKDLAKMLRRDDPEALRKLRASIQERFIVSDMPPAKNVLKQLDAYEQTGKHPSILAK